MSVSLCVVRVEVDDDPPEMAETPAEAEMVKEQKKRDRGARESKTITVETYANVLAGPAEVSGILPTSSRQPPVERSSVSEEEQTVSFFCGNPLVEVTKGVLHLYKENELKEKVEEANTLCLLSVPGTLGAADLLAFAAACQEDISHVRVLRDGSPDHYMALLTFRSSQSAREFHAAFEGVPYSSLEPGAVCRIAWVARAEWRRSGSPPPHHTELPTCPVCLERMDESVAGILSVQCAHAFHAQCLVRWRDARCPVCRGAQTPEPRDMQAVCTGCREEEEAAASRPAGEGDESGAARDVREARDVRDERAVRDARDPRDVSGVAEGLGVDGVEAGTLWICLICGHVGCGRYEGGHAAKHFLASNHTYALQLGSNRVWDYAGDTFVHRLVQSKPAGKLVALSADVRDDDKQAADFADILAQQLRAQRDFYDEKIDALQVEHSKQCEELRARCANAEAQSQALRAQATSLGKENKALERRLQQLTHRLSAIQSELSSERGLAAALAGNQAEWQANAKRKEDEFAKEVADLKEQLRDVMFFVEARQQLEHTDAASRSEIAEASVSVAPAKPRRKRR